MKALLSGLWHHPDTFPPKLDSEKQIEDPSQMQFPALVLVFLEGERHQRSNKNVNRQKKWTAFHKSKHKGGWLKTPRVFKCEQPVVFNPPL